MHVTAGGLIVLDMLTFNDLSLLFALFINSAQPRRTVGNVPPPAPNNNTAFEN
jgi:hypothetical protein